MADLSRHQKKIVERYYEHRDDIMLAKLSELAGELFLADGEKKLDRLWRRVEQAMKNLKVKESLAKHILDSRDPALLARHVKDWLAAR